MKIQENVSLKEFSTFRLGGMSSFFTTIYTSGELLEAVNFAKEKNIPVQILGGGSNTVFNDEKFDGLSIKIEIDGVEKIDENDNSVVLRVGAGMSWDKFVEFSVNEGYSGVEALSAIPGSVGGTPIQNVGAYGQEVSETIECVEVFDIENQKIITLSKKDCEFSYRDSIFKKGAKGKYIITHVTFSLSKLPPHVPHYPGVKEYFDSMGIVNPTLLDIRSAITEIRKNKLPDPREIASCGSFFKNPFVSYEVLEKIKEKYPSVKSFEAEDGTYKIPAGWMLETLGYKGKIIGNFEFYSNNALVLVNRGGGTREELENLIKEVQKKVEDGFGIQIEPEPVFI